MIKNYLSKLGVFKKNSAHSQEHDIVQINSSELKLAISKAFEISKLVNNWVGDKDHLCISIGENCNSSWYTKETGNKQASFPFDWLFTSPEIIHDIIKDDFVDFLDKNLIQESKDRVRAGHKYYHESIFNHKNPLNNDKDYNYYERAVLRFKTALKDKKDAIFVCNILNEKEKRKGWYEGFNRDYKAPINQNMQTFDNLCNLILSINPNARFFFVEQYTEGDFSLDIVHESENKLWVKLCSFGKNNGVKFMNEHDDFIAKILYSGLNELI